MEIQAIAPSLQNPLLARDGATREPNTASEVSSTTSPRSDAKSVFSKQNSNPTADELEKAVKDVKDFLSTSAQNLEFSVDNDTGQTIVKVIDRQTEEVLRQIPSEEMLQIAKALDQLRGVLVNQKA
jgi:flagellar protein FlaG